MKYFWFLLAAAFAGLAFNAGYRAYQDFMTHPGTRGMTEVSAGMFVVALMLIFAIMSFKKGRENSTAEKTNQDDRPAGQ